MLIGNTKTTMTEPMPSWRLHLKWENAVHHVLLKNGVLSYACHLMSKRMSFLLCLLQFSFLLAYMVIQLFSIFSGLPDGSGGGECESWCCCRKFEPHFACGDYLKKILIVFHICITIYMLNVRWPTQSSLLREHFTEWLCYHWPHHRHHLHHRHHHPMPYLCGIPYVPGFTSWFPTCLESAEAKIETHVFLTSRSILFKRCCAPTPAHPQLNSSLYPTRSSNSVEVPLSCQLSFFFF